MKKYLLLASILLLMACANDPAGPKYALPGYYQPAQAQSPYVAAGFSDDMGNYHPPTQQAGGVQYGRWYRPQPGHQVDISPNAVHARKHPDANYYSEVANMASDGDVGTAY